MRTKHRVLNSIKHLSGFLQEGEEFYIGLLFEDFIRCPGLAKYRLPNAFTIDRSFTPLGKGSVTRANIIGKYVRKQPEEKVTKRVHINYNRRDGTHIEFDRDFYVYVKQLLHQYNMSLSFHVNRHGQKVIVSDLLKYDTSELANIKNTHAINIFCEIFNDFEIFTSTFEPAINFNKRFEMELLPKGTLTNEDTFTEVVRIAGHYSKNEIEHKAFQKRLHILKEYSPDIRGKGPNNFYGYIVFGFSNLGIVLLETMYTGNATYVFRIEDYETNIIQDKQSVLNNKLLLRRFYHYDNWESDIRKFLNDRTG